MNLGASHFAAQEVQDGTSVDDEYGMGEPIAQPYGESLLHIAVRRHHSVHTERADKLFNAYAQRGSTPPTKTRCASCTEK